MASPSRNIHPPYCTQLLTREGSYPKSGGRSPTRRLPPQSDDELNLAANFELGISQEVQPAVTDIPRVRVQIASFGLPRQNPHGKAHRESPCFAAFCSITHQHPRGCRTRRKANIGPGKLQRENQGFLF